MLGVAERRRLAHRRRAGRGRGHRRQHVRLHRRGEERVDRHHLRARRVQEASAPARSSSSPGASRSATRASSPTQMPEVDHFLGSSDMLKLGEVLAGEAERMLVGNPADWVVRASDPRVVTAVARERVAEDRRGLQPHLRLLRHPADSRQAALAHGRRRRRARPSSLVASGALELNLVSQDTVACGRDLPRGRRARRSPTLVRRVADVKGVRWVRLFYLYPETLDDALIDLLASHPRVVPVRRHAAPARGRRDAQAHAARPRQGPAEARRRAPAQGHPGPHVPHGVHRRPPGRDRRPSSTSCASSSSGRASSTRSSSATRTRRRARAHALRRQGAGARRREPRAQAHGAPAQDRAREEPRAHRPRARRPRRGRRARSTSS